LGSDVVDVVRFLWFFDDCAPDDDVVVCLAASGDGPVGPGSARATPPPEDSAPTMRSAPAAASDWLRRFRRFI
jgi:hypothetical protein